MMRRVVPVDQRGTTMRRVVFVDQQDTTVHILFNTRS